MKKGDWPGVFGQKRRQSVIDPTDYEPDVILNLSWFAFSVEAVEFFVGMPGPVFRKAQEGIEPVNQPGIPPLL
jgi:hypothetical protein